MNTIEISIKNAKKLLETAIFNVELIPIKLDPPSPFYEVLKDVNIDSYQAVVNMQDSDVLSVVSDQYQLITNEQAIELATKIFKDTFRIDLKDQLFPVNVHLSVRKTFCHIDLIHKEYKPIKIEQDSWLPFIRITNSYNKTYPLVFHIGFHRIKCRNGMLLTKTIEIRQTHTISQFSKKQDIDQLIPNYHTEISKFTFAIRDFKAHMEQLQKIHIPAQQFEPLIKKVLAVKFPIDKQTGSLTSKAKETEERYIKVIKKLTKAYIAELETTAYTALNIMTDIVTHGQEHDCIPGFSLKIPALNDRITQWVDTFPKEYSEKEFNWEAYL